MNSKKESVKQSIAICQIAGCQFTDEEMADFNLVRQEVSHLLGGG